MRRMLKKWLQRLPVVQHERANLNHASGRVSLSIARYKDMARELQVEVERNHFAKYLIYEKGQST